MEHNHLLGTLKLFGSSSEIFGGLRKSAEIFGYNRAVFENPDTFDTNTSRL